ncbi:hypothetical protein SAMN05216268_109154 [Streptomyces yunnanensis]|uniref:Uncharacterized protein n=1 Tax=Streptomyces yunnanensis TaxID=156453 RepID=A0A9X8MXR3_9ACTN|nr:hypothetical protein SAMN05216268_109154 [Streptomyces yunnanensis]
MPNGEPWWEREWEREWGAVPLRGGVGAVRVVGIVPFGGRRCPAWYRGGERVASFVFPHTLHSGVPHKVIGHSMGTSTGSASGRTAAV